MSHTSRRMLLGSALFAGSLSLSLFHAGEASADRAQRATQAAVTATHVTPGTARAVREEPWQRVYMGWGVLSIPPYFHADDGKYDLIVHFHGAAFLQEDNLDKIRINAIVISVNLGISSGAYSDFTDSPTGLTSILDRAQRELDKTTRAPGAHLGRVALSAWSAGFAGVGAILSYPQNWDKVDAVLLGDGFHAAWTSYKQIYMPALEKWAGFAREARQNHKLFALTHSSIGTDGYSSTTETTAALLGMLGMQKTPNATEGPGHMHEIYEVDDGSFHVKGYQGTEKEDHIDHIKQAHATLYPYLKARWSER